MKKIISGLCAILVMITVVGCGNSTDYSEYVAGKTFVYENDGIGGDFTIDINADGTFTYSEGALSSYYGTGNWTIEDTTLTLVDEMLTNKFEIQKGKLLWKADGSDNFTYIEVSDGEAFKEE